MPVDRFSAISCLIEVTCGWLEPAIEVLAYPSGHEPMVSRVIFHETVHYWQQISQGFLIKVTEEDWQRLNRYERTEDTEGLGSYRKRFIQKNAQCGFSPLDLQESLARFWDVHALGPTNLLEMDFRNPNRNIDEFLKEQYYAFKERGMIVDPVHGGYSDLAYAFAMDTSAGNYAKPYQYLTERCSSVVTGTLFPLAGHFALQTEYPIEVFTQLIERASPELEKTLPRGRAIHELWRTCFLYVRAHTQRILLEQQLGGLLMPPFMIEDGPLMKHPCYEWIVRQIALSHRLVLQIPSLNQVLPNVEVSSQMKGFLTVEYSLCCPGDPFTRNVLMTFLPPPCVSFPDGQIWLVPDVFRRYFWPDDSYVQKDSEEESHRIAQAAIHIQERWNAFRRAKRGH